MWASTLLAVCGDIYSFSICRPASSVAIQAERIPKVKFRPVAHTGQTSNAFSNTLLQNHVSSEH